MNKMTIVDTKRRVVVVTDGINVGVAKCRKDDTFDVEVGKSLANARFNDNAETTLTSVFGYSKTKGVIPIVHGGKQFKAGRIYKITLDDGTQTLFDFLRFALMNESELCIENDNYDFIEVKRIAGIKSTKLSIGDETTFGGVSYLDGLTVYVEDCFGNERQFTLKEAKKARKAYKNGKN